jgi:hypothetical protein
MQSFTRVAPAATMLAQGVWRITVAEASRTTGMRMVNLRAFSTGSRLQDGLESQIMHPLNIPKWYVRLGFFRSQV